MICLSIVFISIDMFYVLWIISLRLKLNQELGSMFADAMMGRADKLYKKLSILKRFDKSSNGDKIP